MPAIARSEPFREQACPLGVCDGSGWILGPEDVARPCDCRGQRLERGRSRGVSSAIPARYRGISFDRPPVSDMARDLQTKIAVNEVKAYVEDLDDLGAEKRSDWVLEQLYALVNERYEAQRSIMITTNLQHEELEEQIGPRTVSRLAQICDEVEILGE